MFTCAQLNDNDVCIGVSRLKGEVVQDNIVPISEFDENIMGKKYDRVGKFFYGLTAGEYNKNIAINEQINIPIRWSDGLNIINETEQVKAICNGEEEVLTMVNGCGSFNFISEQAGEFYIDIVSASGCYLQLEVVVCEN